MTHITRIFSFGAALILGFGFFVGIAGAQSYTDRLPMYLGGTAGPVPGSSYSTYVGTTVRNNNQSFQDNTGAQFANTANVTTRVGEFFSYHLSAYDPEGGPVEYALQQAPEGMVLSPRAQLLWTPQKRHVGTQTVTILARDLTGRISQHTLSIRVLDAVTTGGGATTVAPASTKTETTTPRRTSFLAAIFGGGTEDTDIKIYNIAPKSGPVNLYDDAPLSNCSVSITWDTNIDTIGHVVYGTTHQEGVNGYPNVAAETGDMGTSHSVDLGCLSGSETYYYRVISFNNDQRVVSEEGVLTPFAVENVLVAGSARGTRDMGSGATASVLASVGLFLINPFFILILLALAAYYFAKKFGTYNENKAEPLAAPDVMIPTPPEPVS